MNFSVRLLHKAVGNHEVFIADVVLIVLVRSTGVVPTDIDIVPIAACLGLNPNVLSLVANAGCKGSFDTCLAEQVEHTLSITQADRSAVYDRAVSRVCPRTANIFGIGSALLNEPIVQVLDLLVVAHRRGEVANYTICSGAKLVNHFISFGSGIYVVSNYRTLHHTVGVLRVSDVLNVAFFDRKHTQNVEHEIVSFVCANNGFYQDSGLKVLDAFHNLIDNGYVLRIVESVDHATPTVVFNPIVRGVVKGGLVIVYNGIVVFDYDIVIIYNGVIVNFRSGSICNVRSAYVANLAFKFDLVPSAYTAGNCNFSTLGELAELFVCSIGALANVEVVGSVLGNGVDLSYVKACFGCSSRSFGNGNGSCSFGCTLSFFRQSSYLSSNLRFGSAFGLGGYNGSRLYLDRGCVIDFAARSKYCKSHCKSKQQSC